MPAPPPQRFEEDDDELGATLQPRHTPSPAKLLLFSHQPSVKHFHRPPFFPQRAATSGMTPSARSSPHGARSPSARCDPHRPPRVPPARSGDRVVPPARNFHGRAPPCSYRGFYPASISEAGLNWKTSRHLAPKFFERLVEKWPFGGGGSLKYFGFWLEKNSNSAGFGMLSLLWRFLPCSVHG